VREGVSRRWSATDGWTRRAPHGRGGYLPSRADWDPL